MMESEFKFLNSKPGYVACPAPEAIEVRVAAHITGYEEYIRIETINLELFDLHWASKSVNITYIGLLGSVGIRCDIASKTS